MVDLDAPTSALETQQAEIGGTDSLEQAQGMQDGWNLGHFGDVGGPVTCLSSLAAVSDATR